MELSRRTFFKGITAAAAVTVTSGSAIAALVSDPRVETWRMLDEAKALFAEHGNSPIFFDKAEEMFEHMLVHFKPLVVNDETIGECSDILKRQGKFEDMPFDAHWETCLDSTFAIMIVRTGLRDYKLPLIRVRNWKRFAGFFTDLVMAA